MDRRMIVVGGGALLAASAAGISFARMGSAELYDDAIRMQRRQLAGSGSVNPRELVRYATLAANGHNTQPWRFKLDGHAMRIEPDFTRATPAVDPDHHHLFISLGCAAENLALAARASGLSAEVVVDGPSISVALRAGSEERSPLFDAIPHRQSTRSDYDGQPVPNGDLGRLVAAAKEPGVTMSLLTDRGKLEQLRDLVVAGTRAQMADAGFVAELRSWMRFNPRAALASGDGIYSAASGNPILPDWIGAPLFSLFFTEKAESEKYARHIATSSGVAVFAGDAADPEHWIAVGRSSQRFALQATALGLSHAFMNQPVEVPASRAELSSLGDLGGRRPDLVMRFGHGQVLPKSPRRPVESVVL